MKAAYVVEPGKVALSEIDKPEIQNDEVLIRSRVVGVCGSDLHLFHGTHAFRQPPAILGHEIAGEILEIGKNVTSFKVGDRVTVEPQYSCGTCDFCNKGLVNLCAEKVVPGTSKWIGTFVEYFNAPEKTLYRLEDKISYAEGAMIEPLAVAVRTINRISEPEKNTMVILGAGTIGLLVLVAAREAGYKNIICTDTASFNRKMALELGAIAAINPIEDDVGTIVKNLTDGKGADVAIVAADAPGIVDEASSAVKKTGEIGLVSMITKKIPVYTYSVVFNEQRVFGAMTYTSEDFAKAADMVNNGLDLRMFITQTMALADTQKALDTLSEKKENVIKVQICIA